MYFACPVPHHPLQVHKNRTPISSILWLFSSKFKYTSSIHLYPTIYPRINMSCTKYNRTTNVIFPQINLINFSGIIWRHDLKKQVDPFNKYLILCTLLAQFIAVCILLQLSHIHRDPSLQRWRRSDLCHCCEIPIPSSPRQYRAWHAGWCFGKVDRHQLILTHVLKHSIRG